MQHGAGATTRVYERELPGGGYVAIEVSRRVEGEQEVPVTRVSVERRHVDDRREGHTPPVIAEVDGDTTSRDFSLLFQLARDNAAIARGLLEWQRRTSATDVATLP